MKTETISLDVDRGLAVLTLDRPQARNAVSPVLIADLIEAVGMLERTSTVRAVLIRASGDHFTVGGDVKRLHRGVTETPEEYSNGFERRALDAHQIVATIRRMPKPVVVAVQGAAAGFGMSLVMAGDMAIASRDAYFSYAFSRIGLSADGGATYFLPRIVGERKALELAMLGNRFDAAKALELGIVNRVVERADLDAESMALARQLSEGATIALGEIKRLIRNSFAHGWDEHSHHEAETVAAMSRTSDHREGVTAFVEKRAPKFTGA